MANTTRCRKNLIFYSFLFVIVAIFSFICAPFAINKSDIALAEDSKLGKLAIHYVDVGQGDAIFIELPDGRNMLIDAGPRDAKEVISSYIKNLGVSKINFLILTHSDEDHVGGMTKILEDFEVKNIYRPFVLSTYEGTTDELAIYGTDIYEVSTAVYGKFIKAAYEETFEGVLSDIYISYDGIKIISESADYSYMFEFHTPPVASEESTQSQGMRAKGYPTKKYSGSAAHVKNALSPIISLVYGQKKYLFTGDANDLSEPDFIAGLPKDGSGSVSVDAVKNVDVLKVAHHGSESSTSKEFLEIVNPMYAVICVGANNTYKHPTEETLARLNSLWDDDLLHILRTDLNKDIIATSTGSNLEFELTIDGERKTMDTVNGIRKKVEDNKVPSWVIYVIIGVAVLIIIIGIIIVVKKKHISIEKQIEKKAKRRKKRKRMKI